MRAPRTSAVARPFTVSCTRSDPRSVDITSLCSEETSTPMYSAAWARATCIAASLPSSREPAPSRAPEKYRVSPSCGTFTIQAGGLGEEAVFTTAGASAAQAHRIARAVGAEPPRKGRALIDTNRPGRRGLLGDALRLVLQAPDVVQLAQQVLVVGQLVRLLHGGGGVVVVAGVLVGEAQVPVRLGVLVALDLRVLLPVGVRLAEARMPLLPVAALRPADASLELRDVRVLLEVRRHVFLVRDDGAHEPVDHAPAGRARQSLDVDRIGALVDPGVGVVAPLLVGLGDDQPAGGHVDDLEGRAGPHLAAQLEDDRHRIVLVPDPVLGGDLAVLLVHVAVDESARAHHLAELRGIARIGQVAGRERQLAHDGVHVLPVEDREAAGSEQRLLQRVAHDDVAAATSSWAT